MQNHAKHYWILAAMAGLSFMSMYVLMYSMADRFANVYPSINQLYMAGLMTAPMILIELLLMRGMYQNRKLNATAGLVALAALFSFLC
jgi:formate/nitrite transporter FocA (FNT family)